jgi:hypothetical protein
MSRLCWDEKRLPKLGRIFLRNVLSNMRGYEDAKVQFGETGTGVKPNYQVTYPNGLIRAINGSSHDPFVRADEFDSTRISSAFSLQQVKHAYEQS